MTRMDCSNNRDTTHRKHTPIVVFPTEILILVLALVLSWSSSSRSDNSCSSCFLSTVVFATAASNDKIRRNSTISSKTMMRGGDDEKRNDSLLRTIIKQQQQIRKLDEDTTNTNISNNNIVTDVVVVEGAEESETTNSFTATFNWTTTTTPQKEEEEILKQEDDDEIESEVVEMDGTINEEDRSEPPIVHVDSEITYTLSLITDIPPLLYSSNNNSANSSSSSLDTYSGYMIDILKTIKEIAKQNFNTTVHYTILHTAAGSTPGDIHRLEFDRIATSNECIVQTTNDDDDDDDACQHIDIGIGQYYAHPARSLAADFTPEIVSTSIGVVKSSRGSSNGSMVQTLLEANITSSSVCVLRYSFVGHHVQKRYPDYTGVNYVECGPSYTDCIQDLHASNCILYVEDELQLRYYTTFDDELVLTKERSAPVSIVWVLNRSARMKRQLQQNSSSVTNRNEDKADMFNFWLYQAYETGTIQKLYDTYFTISYCPVGYAGSTCTDPCLPLHGTADRYGVCICDSTRYRGTDCSIEIVENYNLISSPLKHTGCAMVGMNYILVSICGVWIYKHRRTSTPVKIAQPIFLVLVLVGCCISTTTILFLSSDPPPPYATVDNNNNDDDDDSSHYSYTYNDISCQLIPWFYSIGFSITFGSLFAKIRRVYLIMRAAAGMQRTKITVQETLLGVGSIVALDTVILVLWTVIDPLQYERVVLTQDKYGYTLSSRGYCTCNHPTLYMSLIGGFHLLLMAVACYMCYMARNVSTMFSEGKYVTIAIISNLQIFCVGVPVLLIAAESTNVSYFLRSAIIFMNDFVVVTLIFGTLAWSNKVHHQLQVRSSLLIRSAVVDFAAKEGTASVGTGCTRTTTTSMQSTAAPMTSSNIGAINYDTSKMTTTANVQRVSSNDNTSSSPSTTNTTQTSCCDGTESYTEQSPSQPANDSYTSITYNIPPR